MPKARDFANSDSEDKSDDSWAQENEAVAHLLHERN